ncbi:MAG: hypothetical protein HYV09_39205 [Deltaproteobacteria bacterium]|nr:hypothetical protein [Deltaproteobacteria bacterium]
MDSLVAAVDRALVAHRFRFADERELQAGIDQVLRAAGLSVAREASLGDAGTIDFLVSPGPSGEAGGLGVEVKTRGSRADLVRQLHRYLQHPSLSAVLVVTTRAALGRIPPSMCEKPVFVHHLVSGAF